MKLWKCFVPVGLGLLLLLTSCSASVVDRSSAVSSITESPSSAKGSSLETSSGEAMVLYSLPAVTFQVPAGVEVVPRGDIMYVYFLEKSFAMVKSSSEIFSFNMDEAAAKDYFDAALGSFNRDGWSNGQVLSEMTETTLAGIPAWRTVFYSEHDKRGPSILDITVTIIDKHVVAFSLVATKDTYQEIFPDFEQLVSTAAVKGESSAENSL